MKNLLIILSLSLTGCTAEFWDYMSSTPPIPRPCSIYDPNTNITSYIPCPYTTSYYYYQPYYPSYRPNNTTVIVVKEKEPKNKTIPPVKQEPRRTTGVDRSNKSTTPPTRPTAPSSGTGRVERTNKTDNRQ